MPVLGHALAGWAAAVWTFRADQESAAKKPGEELRVPVFILLAYLPDLAAQTGVAAGWLGAGKIAHSLGFALAAAAAAAVLGWLVSRSGWRWFVIALALVLLHNAMDFAQASSRPFVWPLYQHPFGLTRPILPGGVLTEFLACGAFALAVAMRWPGYLVRVSAQSAAIVAVMVAAAAGTHYLREQREVHLTEARRLAASRHYAATLRMLDLADRWPSTAAPGRVDHLRGEAYAALGDRARAEHYYLRAYRQDPDYFWVIADLAAFYAADLSRADRVRLAAPYVRRLRQEHVSEPALPHILERIDRMLARP